MMDDKAIAKAVEAELSRSESFMDSRIARERALAYDYYYGREFGNEQDGRSRVVSADVAQAVDAALPQLLEIFVAGDKAVEFAPRNQEDVEAAEQATISANYVFFTQNNGYGLAQDFLKDGLLQKTGVFFWEWDQRTVMSEKKYKGLDEGAFMMLGQAPDWEIVEHTEYPGPQGLLHDVTVRIKKEAGKVRVTVPPPEEIMISPDAMSLDVMDMPFIAYCPLVTRSALIEMGYSEAIIDTLPKGDEDVNDEERIARADRTDSAARLLDEGDSKSEDVYRYDKCWMRLDLDGDGIAELVKICKVGNVVLDKEPTDHIPLAIWTPKVMPHEVIGISLADDVMDLQLLKSTIWRQVMDNLYLSNAPRLFAQGDVNMDDVLTVKPGGVIRGEMNSNLTPITVPFTAAAGFQMLEYTDQEKDSRIGFSELSPGLDPDSINKTATFVREATNQTDSRKKIIARNAAEYGFKPLFRGILYLLAKHQQEALMVRLNNKFVPVDPETWNKEYDMTCNVGLGVGSKDQQLMQLQAMGMDLQAIAQSPFAQVLLDPQKVFNYFEKKAQLAGFKDATIFLNNPVDPNTGEPIQPPPPPKPEAVQVAEIKAQTDMQAAQQKMQADQQAKMVDVQAQQAKLQMDQQREAAQAQADMAVEQQKAELEAALKREELAMQDARERDRMRMEFEYKMAEKQLEIAAQREIAEMNAQVALKTAEMRPKPEARPGA